MIGWPLEEAQKQLFALVDASEIGVTLEPSGVMQPLKSLSLALGLGQNLDTDGCTCDYCTMRETCRFREAGEEHHG
jgi:hypothetical protein